ncbi:hypothetical protein [Agromyces aerolatus]|uniref:hypothetical protein n=1 Tax=Agromyces sp. LY-1074 TaxID=3074080 RepID=UPI002866C503|nr:MULTISPECIES: hypothetical protein [unclassified Agromyces]MDR5699618.1 hypothetical protein [Agromyces sp. LY-1074]MDR5705914.1 hypothetical protein [Agromyces sp. LY-1358]
MSAAVIVLFLVPGIVGSLAVLVMIIVNALLQELRRRISGDPPPAFRSRALLYTVSGIVLVLGTLALGWYLVFTLGITSFAWVMGAAVFAVIFVLGWLGDRAGASARAADR